MKKAKLYILSMMILLGCAFLYGCQVSDSVANTLKYSLNITETSLTFPFRDIQAQDGKVTALYFANEESRRFGSDTVELVTIRPDGLDVAQVYTFDQKYVIRNYGLDSENIPLFFGSKPIEENAAGRQRSHHILKVNEGGIYTDSGVPIDMESIEAFHWVDAGGYVLIGDRDDNNVAAIKIYDSESVMIGEYFNDLNEYAFTENFVYLLDWMNILTTIDMNTGKTVSTQNVLDLLEYDGRVIKMSAIADDALYFYTMYDGIYFYDGKQQAATLVMDGKTVITRDNSPSITVRDMIAVQDGSIILSVIDELLVTEQEPLGGVAVIYYYAASSSAERTDPKDMITLRIGGLYKQPYLMDVIRLFEDQNPGIQVEYTGELAMLYNDVFFTGVTSEVSEKITMEQDAIKAMNTEILAGNGPDIILLDGLPMEKFMESGLLEDMRPRMESVLQDGFQNNVIQAVNPETALYGIPAFFAVPMLWGEASDIEKIQSLEELANFAQNLPEGESLWLGSETSIPEQFYFVSANAWKNAEGRLDFSSDAFREYLLYCKTIQDTFARKSTQESLRGIMNINEAIIEHNVRFSYDWFQSYSSIVNYQELFSQNDTDATFTKQPGQNDDATFMPMLTLALNATSTQKEAAYAFIDFMLSFEAQSIASADFCPVNRQALNAFLEPESGVSEEILSPQVRVDIEALINSLNKPYQADYGLLRLIAAEIPPYLQGENSLDNTINAIVAKTRNYLLE